MATWVVVTDITATLNKGCFAKVEPRTIEVCNDKQNLPEPNQAYAWQCSIHHDHCITCDDGVEKS